MIRETVAQAKTRMAKAAEDLRVELAGVRTGRASTALLDHLKVEYYGTPTPLNQVATLGVPEPSMLTVQPWTRACCRCSKRSFAPPTWG